MSDIVLFKSDDIGEKIVRFDTDGSLRVEPPLNTPDDYILFEAEMDLIARLTACSAEDSNGGMFKPIQFEISV